MYKWLSFLLIVASGSLYQIMAEKVTPGINPFAGLLLTYGTSFLTAFILFMITGGGVSLISQLKQVNVYSLILGITICFYELGFVLAYRNGFSVGKLSPLVSVATMIVLALAAIFLYKEKMSFREIVGLSIAAIGVLLTIR